MSFSQIIASPTGPANTSFASPPPLLPAWGRGPANFAALDWNNRALLLCYFNMFKICVSFHSHQSIQTGVTVWKRPILVKQGKSEGFESCDRPIVRKRPIWVKIGDVLSRVTLKFDGWPWKTIGHLSFAVSSFVQHFITIGEFKLELLCGNAQFGSNSTIFSAVWPWNLTYDLEKQ